MYVCEGEMVCIFINVKVFKFNVLIYFENKIFVGKVDEIFGFVNDVYFIIKFVEGI